MSKKMAAATFALFMLTGGATVHAKTLVFCSEGNPEALNPQLASTTTGMNAARPIFNNLVEFVPGETTIMPALAESWTISDDGTVYTFKLRPGVKFHSSRDFKPTRTLNADDVVFSLMRQWKEDHPYHKVSGATYDYFQDLAMAGMLKAIEKVDELTVRIVLTRPEAPFLANMAMPFNSIHSAEYAAQMLKAGTPERVDQEPIGTGPFVFAGFQKEIAVRYRAFADYWGGRQPIDTLVFSITPNPLIRLTKLKAGECQVMAYPDPGDIGEIDKNPSVEILKQEGLNVGYIAMNTSRKPFDDVRVRRAINMAIDKTTIVEAVYQGAGAPAKNPIPPTLWSYNDAISDYPYDPAAARKLLEEAGLPQGFEADLWYMPVSRPYYPNAKRVAELVQTDLAKIGVRVRLVTDEWTRYRARLQAGEPSMALFGWTGDNGDPDNFLNVLLGCAATRPGGNNIARWCDKDFDSLVAQARVTSDRTTRERLYKEAQVIFHREAPWVPIAHSVVFMATRKGVTGFKMDPLGRHIFQGVDFTE